jgi:hypothetical protein
MAPLVEMPASSSLVPDLAEAQAPAVGIGPPQNDVRRINLGTGLGWQPLLRHRAHALGTVGLACPADAPGTSKLGRDIP